MRNVPPGMSTMPSCTLAWRSNVGCARTLIVTNVSFSCDAGRLVSRHGRRLVSSVLRLELRDHAVEIEGGRLLPDRKLLEALEPLRREPLRGNQDEHAI